jgi:DNA-binding protein Fis
MNKAKLSCFAIACMSGLLMISPLNTFAAETNSESVTLSENKNSQQEKKAAFEEKMKKASDKWKTLSTKQKDEIYSLIESEMQTETKLMDKLVEFGILEKVDAVTFKAYMLDKYNKMKESGEFPLYQKKGNKSSN